MNPADPRSELFRSSWPLYDVVIGANYMFHREIAAEVGRVVAGFSGCGGYAVLDLGCGNARSLVAALHDNPPAQYVGVDVSRPALDEAAVLLSGLPQVRLIEQDMLAYAEALAAQGEKFDLIHSSFAMHHQDATDKARLFQAMAGALAPGGSVLLVDVVRGPGQSRERYLESYLRVVEREWRMLSADQMRELREHVTACDFPETLAELARMARDAGLGEARLLARYQQHHVILFRQSP